MTLKTLMIHNTYQQAGGEDAVFKAEKNLLRAYSHEVFEYLEDNRRVSKAGVLQTAIDTIWSRRAQQELTVILRQSAPHVAHFHNTFVRISPAGYYACRKAKVPVVQTLHNYRLLCPAATFYRDGTVCEACLNQAVAWPGVLHGCYRDSRAATAVTAAMLAVHRGLGTWADGVDVYIALSEFSRQKFIEGGLPADKVVVKPNFLYPDPGPGPYGGRYALFVGRLSEEKGVRTLLKAWERIGGAIPLKVVGDGPLASETATLVTRLPGVEWLGRLPGEQILALMRGAGALIVPSEWYEGFPMVILEAFATGVPVIGSKIGSIAAVIDDGHNGVHFTPGDPDDLVDKVERTWSVPGLLGEMGLAARAEFEEKYTAERNYRQLMEVYELAIRRAKECA